MDVFILAEWVREQTWKTCLGLSRRTSRCIWIWMWMWSPCSSASFALSRKYSNSFSSATQCCSVLCSLPDGPRILWLESKMEWLKTAPAFWLQPRDLTILGHRLCSAHSSNNRRTHCVLFLIWFAFCTGAPGRCAFSFVTNLCRHHNNIHTYFCFKFHQMCLFRD